MSFFPGNQEGHVPESHDFMEKKDGFHYHQSYNLILAIIVVILSAFCTFWILN